MNDRVDVAVLPVYRINAENCVQSIQYTNEIMQSGRLGSEMYYPQYDRDE